MSVGMLLLLCLFGLGETVRLLDSREASVRAIKVANG